MSSLSFGFFYIKNEHYHSTGVSDNYNLGYFERSNLLQSGTSTQAGSVMKIKNTDSGGTITDTVDVLLLMQDTVSNGNLINAQRNAVTCFTVNGRGDVSILPTVRTTGSPTALLLTGAAHTTLSLAEFNDVNLNLARTVNFAAGGGTIAAMRSVRVQAPTYTATTNALTLTDAATFSITAAPTASTNITITRNHALWVQAGVSRFDGQYYTTIVTTTTTLDWNSGNVQQITLASGGQTFTFANPRAGARYVLVLSQPSSGAAGTVTWPTIKWAGGAAPTLTATNSKKDVITIIYDGTDYLGSAVLNF
jgi:hypothetical protein